MSCSAYLWGGLIKNKGGVGLFQISQKERLSCITSAKLQSCNVAPLRFIIAPFQKRPFLPLQFGQKENISGNSIERRVYWVILKIARVLPYSYYTVHRQSRQRMVNTANMIKINPTWLLIFICQEKNNRSKKSKQKPFVRGDIFCWKFEYLELLC